MQISPNADSASCHDARDAPAWVAEADGVTNGSPRWIDKRTASPETYQQYASSTQWSSSQKEIVFVSRGADRQALTCPKAHPLSTYVTQGGYCDGCTRQVESGISVMACTRCNWWLCSNCYRGRVAVQATAPATLASLNGQDRGRRSTPTRPRARGRGRSQSQSPDASARPDADADFAECGCDGTSGRGEDPCNVDGQQSKQNSRSCCEPPAFEVQEVDPGIYEQRIYEHRLHEQRLYEERLYEQRLQEQRASEKRAAAAYAREREPGGDTLSKKGEYRVCELPSDVCAVQ